MITNFKNLLIVTKISTLRFISATFIVYIFTVINRILLKKKYSTNNCKMAGCLDALPHQAQFDWDTKRNTYSAIVAGFLFFLAWWLMIDTAVTAPKTHWTNWYFALTVASTVAMFMVNSVSNSAIQGNYLDEGVLGVKGARLWLMFGFIGSFACIVAGVWVMFGDFVLKEGQNDNWPGIALFLHTFFIFVASLVYKFGRTEELWE